jgi:FAD/FMN-containing dehydrogenase
MTSTSTLPQADSSAHTWTAVADELTVRLGDDVVLTDPAEIARYCRDWHGDVQSAAIAVLRPRTTQDVAAAVSACQTLGVAIVPQGGNTGLVLGGIPDQPTAQVVISLERMNRVRRIDADDFSAVVEAGCVLSALKDAVAEQGLFFPLALGAQGSCQIGGNVSTNAGGINVLRYGMTREQVLGLEVVLPDGSIWNGLSTLRKDNRGIDLKQMFIGAEGTLGIVTAVAIKLTPKPELVETALLGLASLDDVIRLYRRARRECCDLMSAFEFMPPVAFTLAREAMPDLPMPIAGTYPAYVLLEISGSGLVDIAALTENFLEQVMADGLVLDGVVASSRAQAQKLWDVREGMNEGQALRGAHMRTDISVPLSQIPAFVAAAELAISEALPDSLSVSYGHVGDGNVHLNVLPPAGSSPAERQTCIDTAKKIVNQFVDRFGGSISAEHGIGRLKRGDFEARLGTTQLRLLSAIKQAIDPKHIMNPGCQLNISPQSGDKKASAQG